MSNSGKVWDIRAIRKLQQGNLNYRDATRGIYAIGYSPTIVNTVEQVNLAAGGTATDYGDLTQARGEITRGNTSNNTRGIMYSGRTPTIVNTIDSNEMATTGNFTDFGDTQVSTTSGGAGAGNSIRAYKLGGRTANIEYVNIASRGNGVDFGGDIAGARYRLGGTSNHERGFTFGGSIPGAQNNQIDFVNLASFGNYSDFGDLTANKRQVGASGSETRVLIAGGYTDTPTATYFDVIEYITIASAGNATDFGDLSKNRGYLSGFGNKTTAFFGDGQAPGVNEGKRIDKVNIASLGNAIEFATLVTASADGNAYTNGHAGLPSDQPISVTYMPGSGRGLVQKVGTPFNANVSYIHIPTLGNSVDFGDMTQSRNYAAGASSVTRGIAGGGSNPSIVNTIDYTEMASRGNYADFGDLSVSRSRPAGNVGSTTRALFSGGDTPTKQDVIDYITMASVGNATDFGNLTVARTDAAGGLSSSTRGVVAGGATASDNEADVIDYVTIASTGNATDFGDLSIGRAYFNGVSSSTRGVFSSGLSTPSSPYGGAVIDYITIASTGNATDFGDPTQNRYGPAGMSNSIRGVFAGGRLAPSDYNIIDYITIASTGNAADFGDLSETGECLTAASDNHGGLQG